MTKPDICVFHGGCADGFASAWAVWKRFGDGIQFFPGEYGKPPPDVVGKHVVMVDFSYKRDVIERMTKEADSLLIIDHHETAIDDLKNLRIAAPVWDQHLASLSDNRAGAVFDMEHSGAILTWNYFHRGAPPELLKHVQDRDLWRFKLAGSREIHSSIMSYDFDFKTFSGLVESCQNVNTKSLLIHDGEALLRMHMKNIRDMLPKTTRMMTIGGLLVPIANLPQNMASEAGHILSEGQPFAGTYQDMEHGRVFSLRSRDDGMNVAKIAAFYGGGGHEHASGFTVDHLLIGNANA